MTIETPSINLGRLDNIQALRGIAAMTVLFYHLALFLRDGVFSGQSGFPAGPWDQGWAGVDLFFVISGFIMVWTTRDYVPSLRSSLSFLWRRITRIYPLWWACAGIMAVYFMVAYGMPAGPDRVAGPNEAWSYALKSFALWPQETPPLLGLGWTLIHEMWFYLVFAGLLLAPRRCLVPGLLIWALITFVHFFGLGPVESSQAVRKLTLSPLNLEFIGGALTAYLLLNRAAMSRRVGRAILLLGLLWVGSAMIFDLQFAAGDHHLTRAVIYGPAMVCLVWGSTVLTLNGGMSIPRWLIRLGDWSYALYLVHYIVLIAMKRVLTQTGIADMFGSGFLGPFSFAIIAIALSVIFAWMLHSWLERPLLRLFRRKQLHSRAQKSS